MRSARTKPRPPGGSIFIEVLGYLVIMAAISLLVVDIVNILLGVTKEAAQRDTMIQRVDSALTDLRRDAWNATTFTAAADSATFTPSAAVPPSAAGVLTGAGPQSAAGAQSDAGALTGASTITWQSHPDGTLVRTAPDGTRRTWIQMPPFRFTAAGPLLRVALESGPGAAHHEELMLPSQRLLAGGAP